MSQSTDAILFYGYCWSDEDARIFGDDSDEGWPERVLKKRGVVNPWDTPEADALEHYLPGESYEQKEARAKAWTAAHRAELDAWYEAQRQVEAEFGVEVGRHCSGECPLPYLTIAGTGKVARRGYPQEVTVADLAVGPDWDARLEKFVQESGIEKPHNVPKWWLVSYRG